MPYIFRADTYFLWSVDAQNKKKEEEGRWRIGTILRNFKNIENYFPQV